MAIYRGNNWDVPNPPCLEIPSLCSGFVSRAKVAKASENILFR